MDCLPPAENTLAFGGAHTTEASCELRAEATWMKSRRYSVCASACNYLKL